MFAYMTFVGRFTFRFALPLPRRSCVDPFRSSFFYAVGANINVADGTFRVLHSVFPLTQGLPHQLFPDSRFGDNFKFSPDVTKVGLPLV